MDGLGAFNAGMDPLGVGVQAMMPDDLVRPFKYILRRAIVLCQSDPLGIGEVGHESVEKFNIRAPEAVYGLVGIADNADIAVRWGERFYDAVLAIVYILVFIHEY